MGRKKREIRELKIICITIIFFIIAVLFLAPTNCMASEYGKYLPEWIELLKEGNDDEKKLALSNLWFLEYPEYRKDVMVFDPILDALKDKNSSVREAAVASLKRIGELSKGCCKDTNIVPSLIAVLDDETPRVREEAAKALAYYKDKRSIDPLIKTLKDKDPWVRLNAVSSLGELGEKILRIGLKGSLASTSVVSVLPNSKVETGATMPAMPSGNDKIEEVRAFAPMWGELGIEKAIDPIISLLNHDADWRNKLVQQECIIALRKIRASDNKVISILVQKFNDNYLKPHIIKTLGAFNVLEARVLLLEATQDPDEHTRKLAVEALRVINGK